MQHGAMTDNIRRSRPRQKRVSAVDSGDFMEVHAQDDADSAVNAAPTLDTPAVSDKPVLRDARGRIVKGSRRLNPADKPKGPHMGTLLERELVRNGNDIAVVRALVQQARQGNMQAIIRVFDQIDGKLVERRQIQTDTQQTIHLDWSRTPELQQPIDIESRPADDGWEDEQD